MAKYATHKRTSTGKLTTKQRKLSRAAKYASPPSLSDTAAAVGAKLVKA